MRKRIGFALIIISVIMAVVACQPKAWWEDYWWPDRFPGEGESDRLSSEEISARINPSGILSAVFSPDGTMVDVTWKTSDPIAWSSVKTLSIEDCLYAIIDFTDYIGFAIDDSALKISDGKLVIEFKLETELTGSADYSVDSYIVSVLEPLEIRAASGPVYELTALRGFSGSSTAVLSVTMDGNNVLDAEMKAGTFDTDVEIECVVDGEASVLAGNSMTNAEASILLDTLGWFSLFLEPDVDGYASDYNIVLNSEGNGISFTGEIEFNGYFDPRGWYIESGRVAYRSGDSKFYASEDNIKTAYVMYTISISETDPLVITSLDGTEKYTIYGDGKKARSYIYVDVTRLELVDQIANQDGPILGTFMINGEAITEQYAKPSMTMAAYGIRGDGSASNPFRISTEKQLRGFAAIVNDGNDMEGKHVLLTADIDLEGRQWIPIGWKKTTSAYYGYKDTEIEDEINEGIFRGSFDGGGHTIHNLSFSTGFRYYSLNGIYGGAAGFFGLVGNGAEIKNLSIENVDISAYNQIGAFVGLIPSWSETDMNPEITVLENLNLSGDVRLTGQADIGGILGRAEIGTELIIRNCTIEADEGSYISAPYDNFEGTNDNFFGGLAGAAYSRRGDGTEISGCSSSGLDITANYGIAGGLVGHFETGSISGIAGKTTVADTTVELQNSWNSLEQGAADRIGALAGTAMQQADIDSYSVELVNISFDNITLIMPEESVLHLDGVIGSYREKNQDHSNFADQITGEENIDTTEITIIRH